MEAKKAPPKDLLLIKQGVEDVILPAIKNGKYVEAQNTLKNILGVIKDARMQMIQMQHCGMNLLASLRILSEILDKKEYHLLESTEGFDGAVDRIRTFLAQSLMYY